MENVKSSVPAPPGSFSGAITCATRAMHPY